MLMLCRQQAGRRHACKLITPFHFLVFFLVALLMYITFDPRKVTASATTKAKVLVVGASGRVGGSALRSLLSRTKTDSTLNLDITAAGRSIDKWKSYVSSYDIPESVNFVSIDISKSSKQLDDVVSGFDLIVHTAGPFQQLKENVLLKTTARMGKKYIDVLDDVELSRICRGNEYQEICKSTGASAVVSTGIWPGCSSLFAQKVIEKAGGHQEVEKVIFSFHTAGSGGAGPTILTATFLILGEDVLVYENGVRKYYPTATAPRYVDFGKAIGPREVIRLNLIECESCAISGIKNVETFFGTAPPIWNTLFSLMGLVPKSILQNRDLMAKFALFSLPMVYLIDKLVGSANGIRVDVITKKGSTFTGLLTHDDLEQSVGDAICSFAVQVLKNKVKPGVYFPEEVEDISFGNEILDEISRSALSYSIQERKTMGTNELDFTLS